jgi:hypothetical protein
MVVDGENQGRIMHSIDNGILLHHSHRIGRRKTKERWLHGEMPAIVRGPNEPFPRIEWNSGVTAAVTR